MNKIYFDEAGYTGADLTNVPQPYFALASVRFTEEELATIRNDLGLDAYETEMHFKRCILIGKEGTCWISCFLILF